MEMPSHISFGEFKTAKELWWLDSDSLSGLNSDGWSPHLFPEWLRQTFLELSPDCLWDWFFNFLYLTKKKKSFEILQMLHMFFFFSSVFEVFKFPMFQFFSKFPHSQNVPNCRIPNFFQNAEVRNMFAFQWSKNFVVSQVFNFEALQVLYGHHAPKVLQCHKFWGFDSEALWQYRISGALKFLTCATTWLLELRNWNSVTRQQFGASKMKKCDTCRSSHYMSWIFLTV